MYVNILNKYIILYLFIYLSLVDWNSLYILNYYFNNYFYIYFVTYFLINL